MLQHFIKIAYRNLLRRKIYSIINVTGLAVGMACCLLITFYVQHELSYDRYHQKADRIYRLTHAFRNVQKGENLPPPAPADFQVWGNAPVGSALLADFPEVEKVVQFTSPITLLLQNGDKRFQEEELLCIDSTAFDIFSWKMLAGDPHTALVLPRSIVLTESVARKYFDREDPVGKQLLVDNKETYMVTGVMEDVPSNSHFTFKGLISMTTFRQSEPDIFDSWGYVDFYTYFLMREHTAIESLKAKLPAFLKRHNTDKGYSLAVEPLTDAYLRSEAARQPGSTGSLSNVYIFSCIALFILIIACINFMNLATARSTERAKEVGVKKVLGADSGGLVRQFLAESVVLSVLAAFVAIMLARLALPLVAGLSGKDFSSSSFFSWKLFPLVTGFAVAVGIFAGSYPAWFLSRFRTMLVLKGVFSTSSKGVELRKALVVFQFTLSMALIAGTGIVFSQLNHLRSHDLGFNQEQMLVIDFGYDAVVQRQMESIKNAFLDRTDVVSASATRAVPGEFLPNAHTEIESSTGEMVPNAPLIYEVDYDFIPQYKIPMVAGRSFSREFPADTTQSLILNEAATRLFGFTDPASAVGKRFSQWGREGTIIGVVKDFNFRSLHNRVEPLTLRFAPFYVYGRLSLRLSSADMRKTVAELGALWNKLSPQRPFLYHFLDESFSNQYQADLHFGNIFRLFSGLAIFIACLGLFGLAAFTAEQRTKEIGIRKVIGASVAGIVILISKDFIKLVLISILIAVPVSWYAMDTWLNDFVYRIEIGPYVFLKAGLIALAVAMVTVSWQSIKAALANPVRSLRNE